MTFVEIGIALGLMAGALVLIDVLISVAEHARRRRRTRGHDSS
jgi:hypothetical protein